MIGTMVGSFRVVRKLGEGGMGEVYEALQDEIQKRAAIKVLHAELSRNEEIAARFLNEAKAVNIIQHPGIVGVYEYGRLPTGAAFIIMEFLEGEGLTHRMQTRLSTGEVMRICRQIASTLSAAHIKGIVHRDLKPDNVILVPDPDVAGGERAKILDFGIAKVKDARAEATANQTRDGLVMGTPAYMAPEQCRGAKLVDDRADVYSLGVMLYELVAGRLPFVSEEPGTLMAKHIYEAPPPIALPPALAQTVPAGLVPLIERMMDKEPARRPSMREVVGELEALGAQTSAPQLSPPTARRPSPADAAAGARRGRGGVWAIGGLALLLLAGIATVVALKRPPTSTVRGVVPAGAAAGDRPRAEPGEPAATDDDAGCMIGRWCSVPSPAPTSTLLGLAAAGDRVFAVGYAGSIARREHGHWATMASPVATTLRAVWARSADDAWAVGDGGKIVHFDGSRWSEDVSATASGLTGVFGIAGGDEVWAVGQVGTVLRRQGGRWTSLESHTVRNLAGVWASDARNVWIVGDGGTMLRFDGARLVAVNSGTKQALTAVGGNAADELWAVGAGGVVLQYGGFAWAPLRAGSARAWAAVVGSGRGEAWAAGEYGTLARVAGGVVSAVGSGTTEPLTALAVDGHGLWVVGRAGTLMRYRR